MKKFFLLLLMLPTFSCPVFSSGRADSLLKVLKAELNKKDIYDAKKDARIRNLKLVLEATPQDDLDARFNICDRLYEEYKSYQFDSAYVYSQKLIGIALQTKNLSRLNASKVKVGFLLLSSGMFKEAFECLDKINTNVLSDEEKIDFYSTKSRAFSDLADYNGDNTYAPYDRMEAVKYIDSAIALTKPGSYDRLYLPGNRQVISGELQHPSKYYMQLLEHFKITDHQRAMIASGLSYFYNAPNQSDQRISLLAEGAINDIRSSTKETVAIFKLGQELYRQGNTKDAYVFIQEALDEAQFYGARLRKIKIAAVLPIIAAQKILIAENEKNKFLVYFLSIAVVAILIALVSFIVFIQLKRVKEKERIIEDKNVQLEKINNKLIEDTHIKEEYIGYFFNVISGYILKLEKLKRSIERKVTTKKFEDILVSVNEINIKKERENLFYTFDHVFLKIFPNFISTFNSMFKKEDQIWPKDNEVLNTDLRIFALMRLGINDNETIANILEYSVNTIYVYKMRIKAKSLVPGDQFDHRIMDIKAVDAGARS